MFESHVFARSTAHSAVLYWDKPAAAKAGAQYTVYLDGQPVATCGRTHFTLTDLRSQSDYQADVFFGHQCVGSCVFRTTPVKNRLDVTEAPFWAKGDGKTKNTAALQRAVAEAANGTIFVSLEAETGNVQVTVWKSLREKQRPEVLRSRLAAVYGKWQREGDVKNLVAHRLADLTPLLGRLATTSRDFR